jgi:hypothetical protein
MIRVPSIAFVLLVACTSKPSAPPDSSLHPPTPDSFSQACSKMKWLGCAEAFLCDARDCEEHVNAWLSEGNVRMPAGWCADKMHGFRGDPDMLDCLARSSTPEDIEDCGVGCSVDCVMPPCASKAAPQETP